MPLRFFVFNDDMTTDFFEVFAQNQYGTRFRIQEVHQETFDDFLQRNNPKLREELMTTKITKKFYIASQKMNPLSSDGSSYNQWAKATLEQAITHAKEKCETDGEPYLVVQIVRIVKPQRTPIVVEKV